MKRTGLTSSHDEANHNLVQQYQGETFRVISDDTYVLVLRPHVYVYHTCTRALYRAPSGKSLDCGSGSNCSEEQGHDKNHPGDARANRG